MIVGTDVGGVETIAALQAFRKRHSDATRSHATAHSQPTTVDFNHYRAILKNKAVVDDAEKLFNEFKFVSYDANAHIAAIESFEAKAVAKAQETEKHIDVELEDLQATLKNMESARPFEDLTVEDVAAAHPRILEAVQTMIRKGKWTVPGTLALSSSKPFFCSPPPRLQRKVWRPVVTVEPRACIQLEFNRSLNTGDGMVFTVRLISFFSLHLAINRDGQTTPPPSPFLSLNTHTL
jgi:F-type H+-transporting ATPase subunit d